jgi:hypothetical protein
VGSWDEEAVRELAEKQERIQQLEAEIAELRAAQAG